MSVQIKTDNGWKQVAGNVNPQLINDVNQRIDGYADRGYLTKSIIDTTSIKNVLNNNGAVRRGYDVKIPTSGKYYISIENNTGNTIDCGYCAEYGTASNLDNFTVTNGSKREIFKDLEKGNGFTLWNVVNSNVKITVALSEVAIPYVPSNVELQSEIDAVKTNFDYSNLFYGTSEQKTSGTVLEVPLSADYSKFRILCVQGYFESNVGGKRFVVLISTINGSGFVSVPFVYGNTSGILEYAFANDNFRLANNTTTGIYITSIKGIV